MPKAKAFSKGERLSLIHPHLVDEWHPTKNNGKHLDELQRFSEVAWWQCTKEKGHDWPATVTARLTGRGCPYCSGNKINHTNSLAAIYPHLASEWHHEKNKKYTPDTIFFRSTIKVWWRSVHTVLTTYGLTLRETERRQKFVVNFVMVKN